MGDWSCIQKYHDWRVEDTSDTATLTLRIQRKQESILPSVSFRNKRYELDYFSDENENLMNRAIFSDKNSGKKFEFVRSSRKEKFEIAIPRKSERVINFQFPAVKNARSSRVNKFEFTTPRNARHKVNQSLAF